MEKSRAELRALLHGYEVVANERNALAELHLAQRDEVTASLLEVCRQRDAALDALRVCFDVLDHHAPPHEWVQAAAIRAKSVLAANWVTGVAYSAPAVRP